ncbi:MAG: ABC-type transport auxiliary lipoprotein family protein [Candidatus Brocadiia bacterium]
MRPLVPALLLATAAGCVLPARRSAPIRYYAVDRQAALERGGPPAPLVLAVRTFIASPRYDERIFFRGEGTTAGYHDYQRWVELPGEMVTSVVRRALEQAAVAATVVDERLVRRPDLVLEGRVTRFDQVHGPQGWAAACEAELVLKRADGGEVLLATRVAARQPAEAKTIEASVEAMNAAVADLAAQATAAVAKATRELQAGETIP